MEVTEVTAAANPPLPPAPRRKECVVNGQRCSCYTRSVSCRAELCSLWPRVCTKGFLETQFFTERARVESSDAKAPSPTHSSDPLCVRVSNKIVARMARLTVLSPPRRFMLPGACPHEKMYAEEASSVMRRLSKIFFNLMKVSRRGRISRSGGGRGGERAGGVFYWLW